MLNEIDITRSNLLKIQNYHQYFLIFHLLFMTINSGSFPSDYLGDLLQLIELCAYKITRIEICVIPFFAKKDFYFRSEIKRFTIQKHRIRYRMIFLYCQNNTNYHFAV
jgi:hypothetical protein